MRRMALVAAALVVCSWPSRALAQEEEPSSGLGPIITGWILTGVGALNLATLPLCYADFYPTQVRPLCVGVSVGFGAVGLGVGIPLLVVGYNKRSDYLRWRERHGIAPYLQHVSVVAAPGGGMVGYADSF